MACISALLRKGGVLRWSQTLVAVSELALSVVDKMEMGHSCAHGCPSLYGQTDLIKVPS